MKFLKTFLFTISLTFLSFGVFTLSGFCEAAPVLTPDTSSFQAIQGGGMPYYYGMQGYGEMWFMGEEFNTTFMNDLAGAMQDGQDYVISQGYGLPTNGWGGADLALANNLANLFSKGSLDFAQMTAQNYALISHNAKQWGSNAKEYFIGKVDETTGVISDAVGNLVTKVTQEGINNYLGYTDQFIQNDTLTSVFSVSPIYTKSVQFTPNDPNVTIPVFQLDFPTNILVFTKPDDNSHNLHFCLPSSDVSTVIPLIHGWYLDSNGVKHTFNSVRYGLYRSVNVNGVTYSDFGLSFEFIQGVSSGFQLYQGFYDYSNSFTHSDFFINYFFGGSPSAPEGYLYKYSSGTTLALQNLLNQLVGKYVDSNILDQINNKIAQAPIIIEYQNNEPVPVAEPSSDLLDEIGDLIDEAIANSLVYQQLLEPLEESEPEPEPEPEPGPEPNNQGTAVPEDFPTTIFSPINDSVGSMFDFVTIFEPLFYIFSFSTGLLGLWLVVPFVILFLILFRLLK